MLHKINYAKAALAAATSFALVLPVAPATAQTVVQFDGVVVQSCVLSVSTPGVLGVSAESGTMLSSELPDGVAAVLSVVATAGTPTILFAAPTMSAQPAAYTGTPVVQIKYSSPGGANQAYTSSSSQYTSTNPLTDSVTLNAKATDASGFAAGSYAVRTTATCQQ